MIFLAVLTTKIPWRVETGENIIQIAKSVSSFLPTAKHSRDLRAQKIERIATAKRAMTMGNVLACIKPKNRYVQMC